jgi:ABC-type glycerol-3-phosphate transport system substrate-binding protein
MQYVPKPQELTPGNPGAASTGMSRRRLGGLAALSFAAIGAAACGQGPGQVGDQAARKALPPAKVSFFTHWPLPHQVDGQQKVLDLFTAEHPGTTVEMATNSATAEKIITAVAGGAPPDLAASSPSRMMPLLLKNGWLALDDLLKTGTVVKRDHYVDVQLRSLSWKGKLYGIPNLENGGLPALLFNTAHFQEAGLDPSKPPKTPDELFGAHEKLTQVDPTLQGGAPGIKRLGFDSRDAYGPNFQNITTQWNVRWWDADANRLDLNNPALVEAYTWLTSFYRPMERVAQIAEFRKQYAGWTGAKSGMALGAQSTQIGGNSAPGELRTVPGAPRIGYAWYPNPRSEKVAFVTGWNTSIPREARYPEHGWRLSEAFASVKGGQIMFDALGYVNGSKAFLKDGNFSQVPDFKFFQEMLGGAVRTGASFATPIQGDIDVELGKGVTDVIDGKVTPRAMLDDLQARMKPLLENALRQIS